MQPCYAVAPKHHHQQAAVKVKHRKISPVVTKHTTPIKTKSKNIAKSKTKNIKVAQQKSVQQKNNHKKVNTPHRIATTANDRRFINGNVTNPELQPKMSFFASMEHKLVDYVHKMVRTLRYSNYKLGGTNFDEARGVYVVDCSDYVDRILENVYPEAYFNLMNNMGTDKPTSAHYYDFFSGLPDSSNRYWNPVHDVEELKAGDILVFRNKTAYGRMGSGHVMVVMDAPQHDEDIYFVRVTDSAPSGHSEDTRPHRVSGIGIGTLMLRANPRTGQPFAYAWKVGSRWKSNVKIAMARPISVS